MPRKSAVFAIVFLVALIGAWIYRVSNQQAPLTIGFVAGLTGRYADLGVDCRRGVEIALEQQNRQGGINGRPVDMIALDDGQDKQRALAAVSSLLERRVPVIIGHATSSMSMATLPLVNQSETLMIAPTSSTPLLKDIDDNFLRTCSVSSVSAAMMARYLRTEKAYRHAGVIYDLGNKAYSEAWYGSFKDTFVEDEGRSVTALPFTSMENARLLPLVEQMRTNKVDVLLLVANSVDAAMICQQVRKIGWEVTLAIADWAATEQLIDLGGKAVEGVIIQQTFNRKSTAPAYLEFKNRFLELYKAEPGFGALHAYDATMIAMWGLGQKSKTESLKETILRKADFKGLQYDIHLNRYGDSYHATYLGRVSDGQFVLLGEYQ